MIKLFFLTVFLLAGASLLRADNPPVAGQDFLKNLDTLKNPFEDGYPVPLYVPRKIVYHKPQKKHFHFKAKPKPVAVKEPVIKFPELDLQGVIVGDEIHKAIINGQIVGLQGSIEGARVDSVTKQGVELFFKGKKFFLKID